MINQRKQNNFFEKLMLTIHQFRILVRDRVHHWEPAQHQCMTRPDGCQGIHLYQIVVKAETFAFCLYRYQDQG